MNSTLQFSSGAAQISIQNLSWSVSPIDRVRLSKLPLICGAFGTIYSSFGRDAERSSQVPMMVDAIDSAIGSARRKACLTRHINVDTDSTVNSYSWRVSASRGPMANFGHGPCTYDSGMPLKWFILSYETFCRPWLGLVLSFCIAGEHMQQFSARWSEVFDAQVVAVLNSPARSFRARH